MQDLGDRIKTNYENRSRYYLTRRTPVIIRCDGRAFHSRTFKKPFDQRHINSMVSTVENVKSEIQGFVCAYVQSDEISILLSDYKTLTTDAWFDYNKSKIETIAASLVSVNYNTFYPEHKPAVFDARSFNIPKEEVENYFLWRALDWERNSVSMYCRSFFSHKEMMNQGKADQHEMLYQIGKNWATDLSDQIKNGTWVADKIYTNIQPNYQDISAFIQSAFLWRSNEQ